MSYADFLASKTRRHRFAGIEPMDISPALFPHQRDIVKWACRKGRSAVFADTGLGKTLIELEWARQALRHGRVLILTPLMVAKQFEREGVKFGIQAKYRREDDGTSPIIVTNYEMLERFDPSRFVGIVLDESSILKSFDGATRNALISAFRDVPYRLAATATPAPNDYTELGNHSEFLGIVSRSEMLAEYFVHDGETTQEWRLKGHAQADFWRWVASWACVIQRPSDLGYDDAGYALPPIRMSDHVIDVDIDDAWRAGQLFATQVASLSEQRANRRATASKRIDAACKLATESDCAIIWAELNAEQDAITESLGDRCVSVTGSMPHSTKEELHELWISGEVPIMVSKPSIFGFGVNWQHCARMIFVGASHSYEQTYQAIRRIWRFGQKRAVDITIIRAENEGAIVANYRRKEKDAAQMAAQMRELCRDYVRREIVGHTGREWNDYSPAAAIRIPEWLRSE